MAGRNIGDSLIAIYKRMISGKRVEVGRRFLAQRQKCVLLGDYSFIIFNESSGRNSNRPGRRKFSTFPQAKVNVS